jgi:type I restriction-modification system DNA methylase subunit
MSFTFDQSKDEIARLVKHFETNKNSYLAPGYKEAHARQEFIDPLFIALNWDVHNQQQAAPDYREVVVEDSLEMEGHEARKAPDYVFRIGRERKFFAEAKKPGVDLKTAVGPAYQLRRYAWSAKLPLSVLTDFQEWVAYDCRTRPSEGDKTSTARLAYMTYEEYADRWHEVWDVFSREAVWGGSFDQYAQGGKGKRGTSEVDAEFLKEIEAWRDSLARNMALRNPDLTLDEMNDAVQRTIDRIIFLRMVEARGMEEYGQLQKIGDNENIYANLLVLSIRADAKYNSGLFDFSKKGDQVTPRITVDDKILKPILADLYYPKSPYEFRVLPAEILGNVYEQFLGKIIHLTDAHHAKVEEKPEVKKAGGVYYTPSYIVEYIVKNTVGKQIEGKSPAELKGFRILDPACGSGSFLLGAYSFLLDYYRNWYGSHEPEKKKEAVARQADGSWQLTLPERKRILTEHIFGVDIDHQAVEVTKLSLLLKVLEGVKQLTLLNERALPNLDNNIKCGNSLIGSDYFAGQIIPDAEELRRVNSFDWKNGFPEAMQAGGFDCVIGNPPYIRIQNLKEWAPLEVEAYKKLYTAAYSGNYDIYVVFVEKGLRLLNNNGHLGFILPHKFFNAQYGEALRGLISKGKHLAQVVHFGDQQVFTGATTYTCLLFLNKAEINECKYIKVDDLATWRSAAKAIEGVIPATAISVAEWTFTLGKSAPLFEKLNRMPVKLGNVTKRMFQGPITSADTVFLFKELKSVKKNKIIEVLSKEQDEWIMIESRFLKPVIRSGSIGRYWAKPAALVMFPYEINENSARLFSPIEMQRDYPLAWEYLNRHKKLLEERETNAFKDTKWYRFGRNQNLGMWEQPKLMIPYMITELAAYLDRVDNYYFINVTTGGYGITADETLGSLAYLCGLINSHLLNFYLKQVSTTFHGGYYAANKQYIEQLPIRPINFSEPEDKARHDKMVALVEQMLDLHKRKTETKDAGGQERLQRVIDSTDQQIDALVYELYEITPEEIAIVEGAVKG